MGCLQFRRHEGPVDGVAYAAVGSNAGNFAFHLDINNSINGEDCAAFGALQTDFVNSREFYAR